MATILIVDDRSTNRELLVTLLGYIGHRLLEAAEGEEGLAIARAERPDLIITDIVMPTMDGYEFARQVRADPDIGETQIIFYTSSYIVAETRRLAEACGVSMVLSKPIEPEELLETVKVVLDSREKPAALLPASEDFHREHMRLLTDTLAKKVEELEAEITERKRVEEQLRYQAYLLSNVNDAIIASDKDYLTTYWNHAAEVLYGWRTEEVIGKYGPDITKTEFPGKNADEMRSQIRDTGFWRGEATQVKKDGTRFQCEISSLLLRDEKGGIAGYVSINRDITERKQAEKDLRESEQLFSKIFMDSPIAVSMVRLPDGKNIAVNDAWCKLTGFSREEAIGYDTGELKIFDQEERNKLIKEFSKQGSSKLVESEITTKSGEKKNILITSELIMIKENQLILASVIDNTERKKAEEQTQLQLQRVQALHAVDIAISSSFNLNLTLDILLNQVINQLNVDAAAILSFQPITRTLVYAAGRGFRTPDIREARVRLGEGFAGKAILERRMIHSSNFMETDSELPPAFLLMLKQEAFVDYYCVPLLVKGEVKGVLEIFHRSILESDPEWLDFLETLAGQAAIAIEDATLFENLQRSNQELFQAYDATIVGWSYALDLRDKETEGHTQRVTQLTLELASRFGFTEEQLINIRWGALLHDIGKMGVPDSILLKPGKLTDEEWEIMRKHPTFALEMLSPIAYLKSSLDIPYCHHEKWDGSGYPRGLNGEVIPLAARLFAVVDVWDALRSDRPYRKGWSSEKTIDYIRDQAGSHFDPRVVEHFLKLVEQRNDE